MPKVSVIIPVYNVEAYLRQCLDSVVNQTLRDIEVICVDDGSTDGSAAILQEYAAADARVKILSHEHTNAGAARNAAMSIARGEYLGFVDADDFCSKSLFEEAYGKAKEDDADVVSFRFMHYDAANDTFEAEHYFPKSILELSRPFSPADLGDLVLAPLSHGPWARIVRRSLVEYEGLSFQEITRTNDVFFCCMAMTTAKRLSLVDEVLYYYRRGHGGNLQSGNSETPTIVFTAWIAVADALRKRGTFESFRRSFFSASANSFFYVLGTMATVERAVFFYGELRRLYAEDALFSSATADDIAFPQTRGYFLAMGENPDIVGFLVYQRSYLQNRLAQEKWARVASDRTLARAKEKESDLWSQRCKFIEERNALHVKVEEQKKREAELWAQRGKFQEERDALHAKVEEQKKREAAIWAQRVKFLGERNKLLGEVAAQNSRIEELMQKAVTAEEDAKTLRESASYRIGHALTSPFRALRSFFKGNGES